jgi:hypothetical protein
LSKALHLLADVKPGSWRESFLVRGKIRAAGDAALSAIFVAGIESGGGRFSRSPEARRILESNQNNPKQHLDPW